jgi:hypothetical protein
MDHAPLRWKSFLLFLGLLFVAAGTGVISYSGLGIFNAYHEVHLTRMHHLNTRNPDMIYVRPWMSVRYLSTVYRIPISLLFTAIGLPKSPENSVFSLAMLSQKTQEESVSDLLMKMQTAIHQYRETPAGAQGQSGAMLRAAPTSGSRPPQ